ncbi:endolytic transglycosylase MltG [Fervidibacillus halotolerans]|uniref:Endolytic murein transglycosylase n=1 Tax=Fervidibacillus halotolerans TaxID=2980027 RepID=A0A9E8LZG3_9BACI|nr:endolytic transglycosylase MltG [Fervidibacillus halotolerans]WAA11544.1 endolytic transglycosylase MltG [Fervidibacillus halotolerans]
MDSNRNDQKTKEQILAEKYEEAKTVRRIVFPLVVVIFVLIAGVVTGSVLYVKNALEPLDPTSEEQITVEIPLGSGLTSIANILEEKGIIKDATVFKYYVKFKNEHSFQAGTYELTPSMTFDELIASLKTGKVFQEAKLTITIPEGLRLVEIAKIIGEKTGYSQEEILEMLNDPEFIQTQKETYPLIVTDSILESDIKYPLEGYLFPATYSFVDEKPAIEEIIGQMIAKTNSVIQKYLPDMEQKDMTVHELLTMASLIEEEAADEINRKKIASVFYNRMEIGMPLQTDPTVIYAIGEHRDRLFFKDYEIDDPYNTYIIQGLPPGPIANAGEVSIEAALYPENTDYYYFLATKSGDVLFSKTLEEHNEKYREHIGD